MPEVDSLDRSILSVLRDQGRSSFVQIANSTGVTERTVRARMRRLEDEGIIRGYTIRETGIGLSALVRLSVGPVLRLALWQVNMHLGTV